MKFIISATNGPFGEPVGDDKYEYDCENAIIQWFRLSEKYPTCVSIQPANEKDGLALLKWADMNFEKLEVWAKEHKCPYRIDWLKLEIQKQTNNNKCSMQWEYDEVSPFCMG